MKKVLLSLIIMGTGILSAQVISFEQSEGYFPGDINGQEGWYTTGDGAGGQIPGQEIVADMSSDGTQSFANIDMPDYGPQASINIGGYYDFDTPIPMVDGFTFSYDFYGTDPNFGQAGVANDFMLAIADLEYANTDGTVGAYVTRFYFADDGFVYMIGSDGMGGLIFLETEGVWTPGTWHNLRMEYDGTMMTLFLNDVEISTGLPEVSGTINIDHMRLLHNNNGGSAWYDNIRFNDTASVNDISLSKSVSTVYPNPAKDVVNIKLAEDFNTAKTMVTVTNALGQNVAKFANVNDVNISKLPAGVYILTITDGKKTESKKLIKK